MSRGHSYLRQLRPDQVAGFAGDIYKKVTDPGQKASADWHHNGYQDPYRGSTSRCRRW